MRPRTDMSWRTIALASLAGIALWGLLIWGCATALSAAIDARHCGDVGAEVCAARLD